VPKVKIAQPFQYKKPRRPPRPEPISIQRDTALEQFTGEIQGMPASDIEERFARALAKNGRVRGYQFRAAYVAGRNMPGEVEVDFVVDTGAITPVFVDGEFAHKSGAQREEDRVKTAILDDLLYGAAQPAVRISFEQLESQEEADRTVTELF